jgi:hypothetical protein
LYRTCEFGAIGSIPSMNVGLGFDFVSK